MKGKTFRARDYCCWKEFLEISFLESSNKMHPSWLSRLCSDLVVGSVKGGGANWFGSFDLQMNTVIRFNHINITPSRQDGAVYPHPTYTQCKSLKSWMRLKHTARFSPPHTFPKVSFSQFTPESIGTALKYESATVRYKWESPWYQKQRIITSNLGEAEHRFLGNLKRMAGSVRASRCQLTRGLVNSSMWLEGQHVTSCTSSANAASRPLGSIWYLYMSLTSDSAAALQAQSRLAVLVHKSSDGFAHEGKIYLHLELLTFIITYNQKTSI